MKEKRASVVAEMKRLQAETEVITKIFEDEDISKSIQSTRSVWRLRRCQLPLHCVLRNLRAFVGLICSSIARCIAKVCLGLIQRQNVCPSVTVW